MVELLEFINGLSSVVVSVMKFESGSVGRKIMIEFACVSVCMIPRDQMPFLMY